MDIVIETAILILLIALGVLFVLLGLCSNLGDKDDERTDESSELGEEDSE